MAAVHYASMKDSCIFKGIWQTTDINGTSFSKFMHCHLNLFVALNQNFSILAGKHTLLTFSEINFFCAILQNEMLRMILPVIFIII